MRRTVSPLICVKLALFSQKAMCRSVKSSRVSMWPLCCWSNGGLCLCLSCSPKSPWRQELQRRTVISTVRWVSECVVFRIRQAWVFCISSCFLVLLILSPGSIIFWVKIRTIETSHLSAAASSSSRWPLNWMMIKAGRLTWVISEMFVWDSGVCSDGGEVLAAGGASVSAGASQSLRDARRLLHHHQQEAAAAAESDGAAAGGELQVWGPSRSSTTEPRVFMLVFCISKLRFEHSGLNHTDAPDLIHLRLCALDSEKCINPTSLYENIHSKLYYFYYYHCHNIYIISLLYSI